MKIPITNNRAWLSAPYPAGALLLIYVSVRAAVMSFTHDESLTYTILRGDKTWVFTGNHHVLNSILAKGSALVFGYSELALRLPNVLAFLVYFYFLERLLKHLKTPWYLLAFALLFFNPYLLDFFSLCRGYGLGLACSVANLFFWNKVLQTGDHKPVRWALLAGILATYSNYSFFAFFFATSCAGLFFYLKMNRFRLQSRLLISLAGGFLLLLPALWHVGELTKRNELYFGGDRGLLKDTVQTLAAKCLYEIPVDSNGTGMQIFSVFLLATLLAGAFVFFIKKGTGVLFRFIYPAFLLSLLFPVFLFHFFKIKYPMERFAIYYLPLFGLFIPSFFQETLNPALKKWQSWTIIVGFSALAMIPFVKGFNFTYTNNWKYDANTEKMLEVLEREAAGEKILLGVNPLFEPAVNYYRETEKYDWLEKVTRGSIETGTFDYVYCRLDEMGKLPPVQIVATFPDTGTCLVRVIKKG